jgi:hypothetical protein
MTFGDFPGKESGSGYWRDEADVKTVEQGENMMDCHVFRLYGWRTPLDCSGSVCQARVHVPKGAVLVVVEKELC